MLDETLFWLLALPLGVAAFLYLVAPALLRSTAVQNAEAVPVAFDPDDSPPPAPVADFWERADAALAPLGFEREAHLVVHGLTPVVSVLIAVFADRATDVSCLAVFAYAQPPGGGFTETQRLFETATEFDSPDAPDGRLEVGVVNSADALTLPRDPAACRKLLCEWLDDPADLIRVHREAARAWGTGRRRPLPPPESWENAMREDLERENADYVAGGLFEPVRDGKRAMTWKGVYLATWKALPPVKQILRHRRASRARTRLREWGLDELT